ncbi:hypothetical protein [Bacillus mycoides]
MIGVGWKWGGDFCNNGVDKNVGGSKKIREMSFCVDGNVFVGRV